ncbi:ABC transporter permease [Desulfamplus magnetovallimortis]|uniref:ABC transporter permease n=1 Tax=Desulfamplus magnetovallimortis TaxID=1246637 RepID=UPI0016447484|nr:ABC transporter permease [Desulfamplus magnetovallimortis]
MTRKIYCVQNELLIFIIIFLSLFAFTSTSNADEKNSFHKMLAGIYEVQTYPFQIPALETDNSTITITPHRKTQRHHHTLAPNTWVPNNGTPATPYETCNIPPLTFPIEPFHYNAISPQSTPPEGIEGHLVFAGNGELKMFNHQNIKKAIVLMDINSGKNWLNAANLGASALIFYDPGDSIGWTFKDKREVTPLNFPMFRMEKNRLEKLLGIASIESVEIETLADLHVTIKSKAAWKQKTAENHYAIIKGNNAQLSGEMIIVEAFVPPDSGSDQSCSINTLYDLAEVLQKNPPSRSVMLIATEGHKLALAGWREMVWSLGTKKKVIKNIKSELEEQISDVEDKIHCLNSYLLNNHLSKKNDDDATFQSIREKTIFNQAISGRIATEVDDLSRELITLRIKKNSKPSLPISTINPDNENNGEYFHAKSTPAPEDNKNRKNNLHSKPSWPNEISATPDHENRMFFHGTNIKEKIKSVAEKRLMLRKLEWTPDYTNLSFEEKTALSRIIKLSLADLKERQKDLKQQKNLIKHALSFRSQMDEYEIKAAISLHLSSHGTGFGGFDKGWLYPLKSGINRSQDYRYLNSIFKNSAMLLAKSTGLPHLYQETLRPNRLTPWQSYFPDRPALGGEVTALAGMPGFTFATLNDARSNWGTPSDTPENTNNRYAARQSSEICHIIAELCNIPVIPEMKNPRNGFATITGRCKRLLHGELFAVHPATDALIFASQGQGNYYAISDTTGSFTIKGVADKKHVLDKVIIEGYRFNESDGRVELAIDKKQTGKSAYRLKMNRKEMSTDIIMFNAEQTTIFNLMEPGNFNYMTKIDIFDGRRDALPLKYWYSRIDTRSSTICSIFTEPGTPIKLTLSDSVLKKKLILTNASPEKPQGTGYITEKWPAINNTSFHVATDMWNLITPRVDTLESHGIFNASIRKLQNKGTLHLKTAESALEQMKYDKFQAAATASWALASKVYEDVEKTQKDVLFGVLFYIALFVPFAFCMERLLFGFANIYKRIISFITILIIQITIIYNVHPAFQLAYSPIVIILAFFIIGLSTVVSMILFLRFEREMVLIQRKTSHMRQEEISSLKAFTAAFHLGVSNLKRRRTRTALTCTTLVILTFTIMGFTSVKSIRLHTNTRLDSASGYNGFLMKQLNWKDFPHESLGVIKNTFSEKAVIVPRVWLENHKRSSAPLISVIKELNTSWNHTNKTAQASAIVGFDSDESLVTAIDRILVKGRWFDADDKNVVIIPLPMADSLSAATGDTLLIRGTPYSVKGIFDPKIFNSITDLDGEIMTPAIFPDETTQDLTEVEMEALESGEDISSFESRYTHIPTEKTVIIPAKTLLAYGGKLKGFAGTPITGTPITGGNVKQTSSDLQFKDQSEKKSLPSKAVDSPKTIDSSKAVELLAREVTDRFKMVLFTGTEDGSFVYNANDSINYSGVPNILVPVLISIMIVLNTMISSVHERKREIGIYTSVGLAPNHVAFLFIAEAMAFAVISVVLGYLAAQASAHFFANTPMWEGITVNYSSIAGAGAMILVIAVVMISVIYPSKMAARIAIPDVNKTWKLPEPKGNCLEITLPFLLKMHEHKSISVFLYNWFREHQDYSHGIFSTGEVKYDCSENYPNQHSWLHSTEAHKYKKIVSRIWLAPFDLGMMQKITITFTQSMTDSTYLQIKTEIERESGEADIWLRLNKRFLFELRKQLLIWRSLDEQSNRNIPTPLPDPISHKTNNSQGSHKTSSSQVSHRTSSSQASHKTSSSQASHKTSSSQDEQRDQDITKPTTKMEDM